MPNVMLTGVDYGTRATCGEGALYPETWDNLAAGYDANLGPTGLTLYDLSGNGRHGTLYSGGSLATYSNTGPLYDEGNATQGFWRWDSELGGMCFNPYNPNYNQCAWVFSNPLTVTSGADHSTGGTIQIGGYTYIIALRPTSTAWSAFLGQTTNDQAWYINSSGNLQRYAATAGSTNVGTSAALIAIRGDGNADAMKAWLNGSVEIDLSGDHWALNPESFGADFSSSTAFNEVFRGNISRLLIYNVDKGDEFCQRCSEDYGFSPWEPTPYRIRKQVAGPVGAGFPFQRYYGGAGVI